MSTTTPIGLEFFKDARGVVTHVLVRGGQTAEQKYVRKNAPAPAKVK
jgi:hypothetical protein